jgi:hypothetical protein
LDTELAELFINFWTKIREFVFTGKESEDNEEEVAIILAQRLETLRLLMEKPYETEHGVCGEEEG